MVSLEAAPVTTFTPPISAVPRSWQVLTWLLRSRIPHAKVFRYSCTQCFEFLWSLLSDDEAGTPACDCLLAGSDEFVNEDFSSDNPVFIIAYDDIPSTYARPDSIPDIHLDTIFSPTTLFMLLTRKRVKQGWRNPIRWIVIDPNEWTRTDKETLAISQMLTPHLQIIDGSEASLLSTVDQMLQSTPLDERKAQAAEDHLKLMVTAPGSRHAVSNVVGPVLLGFQPAEKEVKWIVTHLRHILSSVGLAPAIEENVMVPSASERQKLVANGPIEFVLLDDQHRNGWEQIVRGALGADEVAASSNGFKSKKNKSGVAVTVHSSPEFILRRLEKIVNSETDLRFRFTVGERNRPNEILLLDLRLFEGSSLQTEAKFFARVLKLAERFRERRGLPWPGFNPQD